MNFRSCDHALDSVFHWASQATLSATVLIALVLLAQSLFRRVLPPRWCYALGLLVLLRLALPFAPASSWSIFNFENRFAARPSAFTTAVPSETAALPASASAPILEAPSFAPSANSPVAMLPTIADSGVAPASRREVPSPSQPAATNSGSLHSVVKYLWLAGCLAMLALIARRHRQFAAQLRRWEPVHEPRVLELLEGCQAILGVKRNVPILAAHGLNTPALFGVVQPRLLIPAEMLRELDDRELRHIFLHELVHLRRGDVLINWAMIALRALHWFNPAVWLAFRRLRADQEIACDATVLARLAADEQLRYGCTLVKLLTDFSATTVCPGAVPFITHKQTIKRRIKLIANFKPAGRLAPAVSILLLSALVFITFTRAAVPAFNPATTLEFGPEPDVAPYISADENSTQMAQTPSITDFVGHDNPGTTQPSTGPISILIAKKGTIRLNSSPTPMTLEQLRDALATAAKNNPHVTAQVLVDGAQPYEKVTAVLRVLQEEGIAAVELHTEPGSAGTGAENAPPYSSIAVVHGPTVAVTLEEDGTVRLSAGNNPVTRAELEKILRDAAEKYPQTLLQVHPADAAQPMVVPDWVFDVARKAKIRAVEIMRLSESTPPESDRSKAENSSAALLSSQLASLDAQIASIKEKLSRSNNASPQTPSQDYRGVDGTIAELQQRILEKQSLLDRLNALSHDELRQVLPTTVPDAVLTQLLQDLNAAESKYVSLRTAIGPSQPNVAAEKDLIAALNSQIDQRVAGILSAQRVQIDADRAEVESLKKQFSNDTEKSKYDEFIQLKAELDRLEQSRDEMLKQLKLLSDEELYEDATKNLVARAAGSNSQLQSALAASSAAIAALKQELAALDEQIRLAESNVNELTRQFSPGDRDPIGATGAIRPVSHELIGAQILDTKAKAAQLQSVLSNLTHLTPEEQQQVIPTVYPDTILPSLLQELNAAKSKLVELSAEYGTNQPDVITVRQLIADKEAQVDARVKGILRALRVQLESTEAEIGEKESALEQVKATEQETARRTAPYYQAKENLEELKKLREVLDFRLGQEQANNGVSTNAAFFVVGRVNKPGGFPYTGEMHVVQAVSLANWFAGSAPHTVEIIRAIGGKHIIVNCDEVSNGRASDVEIYPGDTVVAGEPDAL